MRSKILRKIPLLCMDGRSMYRATLKRISITYENGALFFFDPTSGDVYVHVISKPTWSGVQLGSVIERVVGDRLNSFLTQINFQPKVIGIEQKYQVAMEAKFPGIFFKKVDFDFGDLLLVGNIKKLVEESTEDKIVKFK